MRGLADIDVTVKVCNEYYSFYAPQVNVASSV